MPWSLDPSTRIDIYSAIMNYSQIRQLRNLGTRIILRLAAFVLKQIKGEGPTSLMPVNFGDDITLNRNSTTDFIN